MELQITGNREKAKPVKVQAYIPNTYTFSHSSTTFWGWVVVETGGGDFMLSFVSVCAHM